MKALIEKILARVLSFGIFNDVSSRKFDRRLAIVIVIAVTFAAIAVLVLLSQGGSFAVLSPKGVIAEQQRDLLVFATALSFVVIIPVFILTFGIVWRYRADNEKAEYAPDWDHSRGAEALWWGIPLALILVLGGVIWKSSHDLDPFKSIASDVKPVKIQVVALRWKWLFIYPEQKIVTVNYVNIPEDTPIEFLITSDAPMNSFWIPQLAGQIYAMPGMSTELNVVANEPGTYAGSSANLSGEGFAGMKFSAVALTRDEFAAWAESLGKSEASFGSSEYAALAQPGEEDRRSEYSLAEANIFHDAIMKYMAPAGGEAEGHHADASPSPTLDSHKSHSMNAQ